MQLFGVFDHNVGVEFLQLLMKLLDLLVRFFQHVVNISEALLVCGDLKRREQKRREEGLRKVSSNYIKIQELEELRGLQLMIMVNISQPHYVKKS